MIWLLPFGALAAILWATYPRDPDDDRLIQERLTSVLPSRHRADRDRPLVTFTHRFVPYTVKNRKTGKVSQGTRQEVVEEPAVLALEASQRINRKTVIPLQAFTLATVLASEGTTSPKSVPLDQQDLGKVAIAHAVVTESKKKGTDILHVVTRKDLKFGDQKDGRYASTFRAPTIHDLDIAEAVLDGRLENPVPGANHWDSPKTQNWQYANNQVSRDADAVAEDRRASNLEDVYARGVDPTYLRLWRPKV